MGISGLPGAELIGQGLQDLAQGIETDAAWLVLIGAPRLAGLGLACPHRHERGSWHRSIRLPSMPLRQTGTIEPRLGALTL